MNEIQKNEIMRAVEQKVKTSGSQNKAAEQIGVNVSTVSKVRKGDPENLVSDSMWLKIAANLKLTFGWQTAVTVDYKRIHNICSHSQLQGLSRAISYAPGSGKSYALKEYAANNPNVFYIESEEYYTKKVFLRKLMIAMGLTPDATSIAEMVDIICDRLNKTEKPLIILDEADKLKDGVLNFFKTFYNKTSAGFVLAGTPYLRIRIDRGVRLNRMCYREIYSRLGGEFLELNGVNTDTVKAVCAANGVTDTGQIQEVCNRADGDLRRVKAEIERIRLIALKN